MWRIRHYECGGYIVQQIVQEYLPADLVLLSKSVYLYTGSDIPTFWLLSYINAAQTVTQTQFVIEEL